MLETARLSVTEAAIQTYAELTNDFNPIHVDAEFAATTAMGRPIAHGTLSLCLIWQCLHRNFGAAAFSELELDVRFVKPVYIGENIVAGGQADTDIPGRYQIWVRGDDGSDRIVGLVSLDIQRGYKA